MTRPALTDEQRVAAHRGGGDACVMAGAGSGKTTVLVERALHLTRTMDLRDVAALTFTEKAAAEMRERIARAVGEQAGPAGRRRRRDVEFAPISTIHAFCARTLREHAIDAGVDPSFSVLEETGATLALEDAFAAVERAWKRAEDPRLAVLRLLGNGDVARELRRFLEILRSRGLAAADLRWRLGSTGLAEALAGLEGARRRLEAAVDGQRLLPKEARKRFDDAYADFPPPDALHTADFAAARQAFAAADGDKAKEESLPLPRACSKERQALYDAYEAVGKAILDEIGGREVAGPFRDLLAAVEAAYAEGKRARNALDFTDLEREMLALLDRLAAAGRRLSGAPKALLVDEYQDVNPLQARILRRLREGAGSGRRVDLFAVGDPKQSIYRFRGADVSVIRAEWDAVGEAGRAELSESFRSRPELVAFHNEAFASLFDGGSAGIDAQEMRSRARFHPGHDLPPELLVVDAGPSASGPARHDAEARAIARRIREWVEGGAVATRVCSGAETAPRPLGYGDVAVLLRTRTHVKRYERVLSDAGIPFHVGRGQGFYQTEEIADLVHLLRVVHDPNDPFAVAAWMTSPAVGATDADLLAASLDASGSPFDRAARLPGVAPSADVVRRLRRVAAGCSLEETVAAAIEAVEAVPSSLLQDGGLRRARNVEKTLSIARRLDAAGGRSLQDFLRWLDDLRNREVDEPEAATGAERDSVALLTIHGAKGLQWPCVIVADAGQLEGRNLGPFALEADGAFSWRLRDPLEGTARAPGGLAERQAAEARDQEQEALRLLYVALTRAEDRLVVSMSASGPKADGAPRGLSGWGAALWRLAGATFVPGTHAAHIGDASVRVTVEREADDAPSDRRSLFRRFGAEGLLAPHASLDVTADDLEVARAAWARVARPSPTLGRTPYVASVSELLLFAESPQRYYRERLLGAEPAPSFARRTDPDDPASGREEDPAAAMELATAQAPWDEGAETVDGVDRAALGRAVHLVLERIAAREDVPDDEVDRALAAEFPDGCPGPAKALARAMVGRFLHSRTAPALWTALRDRRDVRREAPFHARIAFPRREEVAGFDSILVKGTIDLWLPDGDSVRVLDHKTNSPRGRLRTVGALAAHYAPQLRLYALAAERILGKPVAGAGLLVLDPEWNAPVEVDVDVSGEALGETRRLCRAYAVAMLEGRFPERWQDLLR